VSNLAIGPPLLAVSMMADAIIPRAA